MSDATTEQLLLGLSKRVEDMQNSIERVERGIFGDIEVGHHGLVKRVDDLDRVKEGIGEVHEAMEQRRADGDKRLHGRVDAIEKKIDRFFWTLTGAFLAGGGVGAALVRYVFG